MRIARTLHRLERGLLQRYYGFDRWHIGHAGERYAADIVRCLNGWPEADRQSVVEIGCGLGDILRRLHFRSRLGLDRDPRVLAAARLLSRFHRGTSPRFDVFDFPKALPSGAYNAIIMVNWIHEVDPDQLREAIDAYFTRYLRPGGSVVLDTVDDPAYTYNHDVQRFAPAGAVTVHLGRYGRNRDIWVLQKAATNT